MESQPESEMKLNPFKRNPSPAFDALKERFEAAKNIADPAEKYMALAGVMSDAMEGYMNDSAGPFKSDNYYRTMGRSVLAAAAVSAVAALCVAAAPATIFVAVVIGGGIGGTALGFGTCAYKSRMGYGKEYLQMIDDVGKPMAEVEKLATNVAVTQSPAFDGFAKKYPDLAEHFLEQARKEKIDALPPDVAAKLLGDSAPAKPADKPGQEKPGLAL